METVISYYIEIHAELPLDYIGNVIYSKQDLH